MKKGLTVAIALLFGMFLHVQTTHAQELKNPNNSIELGVGFTSGGFIGGVGYFQDWGVLKNKALRLGYGVRFTGFSGSDGNHASAPPAFWNDETMRDSLFVGSPQMNNIALYIGASYLIADRFELGFNIDALGYTFGGDKEATHTATSGNGAETATTVNPGSITALLWGPNDIGMVRSDFFVGYKFNDNWKARVGFGPLFTEYRTETELQEGNTRYRGTYGMISLGAVYSL